MPATAPLLPLLALLAAPPEPAEDAPPAPAEAAEADGAPRGDPPARDAGAACEEEPAWDVSAPHGRTREVALELHEGTWMDVSVHGDTVYFDLLGDIWAVPLEGGEARRITSGPAWDDQPAVSPDGRRLAFVSDRGGNEDVWVMDLDGDAAPRRVTDDPPARFTHPTWEADGEWLVVRRRTVDTRSIGVTELWAVHVDGGKGFALTKTEAHPHAGEPFLAPDAIWFSSRHGRFEYGGDPVAGLWDIVRLDRRSGRTRVVVTGPGGAARPMLAPDGRTLVFVSRDRDRTLLEAMDLRSGRRRVLWDGLDRDAMEGFALHGVYPRMDWTDDGDLVLWARGGLWRVGLDGRRARIPFVALGTWTFRDVERPRRRIGDEVRARVLRWVRENPADGRLAFSALGALWVRGADGGIERVGEGTGYAPAWSPDGRALAWTSWRDCPLDGDGRAGAGTPAEDGGEAPACGGALHVTRGRRTETLLRGGQLVNPAWDEEGRRLVVLRAVGGGVSPDLRAATGWDIVLVERRGGRWTARTVGTTGFSGPNRRAPALLFRGGRVWFAEDRPQEGRKPPDTALASIDVDGIDADRRTHLLLPGSVEVVPSPDLGRVAVKRGHQVRVLALPRVPGEVPGKEGELPERTLTRVVGDWLEWSPDGERLCWMEGPERHCWRVDGLAGEVPEEEEVEVDEVRLVLPRARPRGRWAIVGATALTMEGDRVVEDATIVIDGDRIESVEAGGAVPPGVERVEDARGRFVIPGLVDVHAHLHYTAGDVLPEQEWRYLVNLDYGVTTVFDPSAATDLVFTQAERVAAGFERGPRVFSTGFVLYGALDVQAAETPDRESAFRHVERLRRLGAIGVKVYQQSRREQRQWYVDACEARAMLCIAEGGGDLDMDLGMVADGISSVEHALPVAPIYEDVRAFWAAAAAGPGPGPAYTPTLLVAYGSLMGEHYWWQHEDPLSEPRLLRHTPRRLLDARGWRLHQHAREADWAIGFRRTAADAAALARRGVAVLLGAHGQLQGLGAHWELWSLAGPGAMTPMEALRAATIEGARHLGLDADIGSIAPGKLADLVVLDADPREDVHNTARIAFFVKNGEIVAR